MGGMRSRGCTVVRCGRSWLLAFIMDEVRTILGSIEEDDDEEKEENFPSREAYHAWLERSEALERELRAHVARIDAELAAKRKTA